MPGWAFALAFVAVFAVATVERKPDMNLLFGSPEQKVAAIRAAWTAIGSFLFVLITTWAVTDTGIFEKPVLAPSLLAALAALGFRGVVEGRIDKGKGNA